MTYLSNQRCQNAQQEGAYFTQVLEHMRKLSRYFGTFPHNLAMCATISFTADPSVGWGRLNYHVSLSLYVTSCCILMSDRQELCRSGAAVINMMLYIQHTDAACQHSCHKLNWVHPVAGKCFTSEHLLPLYWYQGHVGQSCQINFFTLLAQN